MNSNDFFENEAVIEWLGPPNHRLEGMRWMVGRMRVPGGWLVTTFAMLDSIAPTTVFVADTEGSWEIGNEGSLRIKAEEELGLVR